MNEINFSNVWKKSPKEKKIMVSNFVKHCYPYIKKNNIKKILDVGCGNGLGSTLPLLKLGFEVHGFDFTKEGIEACKQNLKDEGLKQHIKKADMYKKFPYKNKTFDSVTCFQAIFHGKLKQIKFALNEIKRVLNNNGIFFCSFLRYEDINFDKKKKLHFVWITYKQKKFKSWLKQDNIENHLFYNLSKKYEYNVPHYYMSKEELKYILNQYFSEIEIKIVKKDNTKLWFVICKK